MLSAAEVGRSIGAAVGDDASGICMGNAAIFLHPNGFDTSSKRLLGRHSAGESFAKSLAMRGAHLNLLCDATVHLQFDR